MNFILVLSAILACNCIGYAQSGRRGQKIVVPVPPPEVVEPTTPALSGAPPVSAQKTEDYRCDKDGHLARVLEPEPDIEKGKPDTHAQLLAKPTPSYTKEARRLGVQGQVILRVLLSSEGEVSRIRVHHGLPAGLTENAIYAACRIKFKPAIKNGEAVSRWVTIEYAFRVSQPSIFSR
jgi:TonB family protein